MANTIDLCPQCRGRLVPIGERTGGFSAKKAVIGTVVAGGAVGLAAGATGKQLVTLQCVKCGYTIETDAKTAKEATEFGEAFEQYCELQEQLRRQRCKLEIPHVKLVHQYGYGMNEFKYAGYVNRAKDREKIGIDIDAVEKEVAAARQKYDKKIQLLNAPDASEQRELSELRKKQQNLTKEKSQCEAELAALGFFKFAQKKAAQEKIASLSNELASVTGKKDQLDRIIQHQQEKWQAEERVEIVQIRSELVERCRVLAYEWMKENLPEEYHQFLSAVYSVLDDEGKDSEELHQLLDPETESMTTLQLSQRIGYFSNPYVSDCGRGFSFSLYFGADGARDISILKSLAQKEEQEKAKKAAKIENYRRAAEKHIKDRYPEESASEREARVQRIVDSMIQTDTELENHP